MEQSDPKSFNRCARRRAAAAAWSRRPPRRAGQGAVLPAARLSHRRLRAERHAVGERQAGLPEDDQRPRRRHQRRQADLRGMRDRLRHRQGRRVLRAPEGQAPRRDAVRAAVDRHHVRADRQGARRQDPADHGRLRPVGGAGRQRRSSGTSRSSAPTGPAPTCWSSTSPRRKAASKGKKIALVYHDSPVRQGADPAAAGARQDARLRAAADPGDAPGRRAEGGLAAGPPEPARLRAACGAGA